MERSGAAGGSGLFAIGLEVDYAPGYQYAPELGRSDLQQSAFRLCRCRVLQSMMQVLISEPESHHSRIQL